MTQEYFQGSVLITGGTSGLGYECALSIARQRPDYQVIVASRSDPNDAAASINKSLDQSNVKFLKLDLSSLEKVRAFASEWKAANHPPIEALVLNAALQLPGEIDYTVDGYEKTFGISHVGHALLLSLLRPHLADTARVVIVSSGTHDPEVKTGMPDAVYNTAEELAHPTAETSKNDGRQRYTSTKLANVLYTYALHRRFAAINEKSNGKTKLTVVAFEPGLMPGTGLGRAMGPMLNFVWLYILPALLPLLRLVVRGSVNTVKASGESLAWLSISSDIEGQSGVYYDGREPIKSSKTSYEESKQEDLFMWTTKTVAKDEGEKSSFEWN